MLWFGSGCWCVVHPFPPYKNVFQSTYSALDSWSTENKPHINPTGQRTQFGLFQPSQNPKPIVTFQYGLQKLKTPTKILKENYTLTHVSIVNNLSISEVVRDDRLLFITIVWTNEVSLTTRHYISHKTNFKIRLEMTLDKKNNLNPITNHSQIYSSKKNINLNFSI